MIDEAYHQSKNRISDSNDALSDIRRSWSALSLYERFEQLVIVALTALISLVVIAALAGLSIRVFQLVAQGIIDPADHSVFQTVFGMIFTVLIALEFNHSIISVLKRHEHIVQARAVVLIALLALGRKFIILDASATEPLTILGLAVAILSLGAVCWLVRDQDRKDALEERCRPSSR
ncbi:phosphate-starvation-inducible PsiE family protein [Rhizobium sp. VS19-DR104.2]|uniref:phosphate-starvation-inducible PsiE family protein n=1 Tax=unclassified Rhizobium TaxID=2613769 RepID=UPI001CC807D4|nr:MULTISPECIES: phosphate-starvation-inducible PsiE family protein [unclassified Rhizobium]MBZ5762592.1 phosphate-starvation-inducible PsiE family protein [Rhizobium sp. VS19-DR96]MBZ5768590.1 phosphate-starvation-inducible PsiE family protein [Rhizobium sp. VS19-DR129.2]MBZ5776461.1 phosphate-starvation-inducible PsiE family protein [Rhizobium sp. VS19-DRK62.2]MBZ5787317.1 phosphate-starvation-inducible PsiE family protein [Rhizobium sp. VS19-DR121]MBZ5804614.1 phosphate-starvation-inducible